MDDDQMMFNIDRDMDVRRAGADATRLNSPANKSAPLS
jgi:hypothetical protein